MTVECRARAHFAYCGAVLLAATLIGGATERGLWTDHFLQLLLLPAVVLGLGRLKESRIPEIAVAWVVLVVLLLLAQFFPVYHQSPLPELMPSLAGWSIWAIAPEAATESALLVFVTLAYGIYASRLSDSDQQRCLLFLLVGYAINFVAVVVQLSHGNRAIFEADWFPYVMKAGFFANENHFAALSCLILPLLSIDRKGADRWHLRYASIVCAILLVLLAVGSLAGICLSIAVAALGFIWLRLPEGGARAGLALVMSGSAMVAVWLSGLLPASLAIDATRLSIWSNTMRAVVDHWPVGAGLGSFQTVYPVFEAQDQIHREYANHAHNDYLEIGLETGLAGWFLAAALILLIVRHSMRNRMTKAAFLATSAVLVHSLVDYPLRSLGTAIPFAFLVGVILSARNDCPSRNVSRSAPEIAARTRHIDGANSRRPADSAPCMPSNHNPERAAPSHIPWPRAGAVQRPGKQDNPAPRWRGAPKVTDW